MRPLPQTSALAFVLFALSACAPPTPPADPGADSASTSADSDVNAPREESDAPKAHSASLVERAQVGRAAEIRDAKGAAIATLVPEDFAQLLTVPDIANNTSEMISLRVPGTDIVAVSVEEGTGRILLAVRGFIYAEVSTDLVFLLHNGRDKAPPSSSAFTVEPVYFDGPNAEKSSGGVRPHFDVTRVSFQEGGRLLIETADASGGASKLVYGADRTAQSCTWTSGESRRCPSGITAQ